MSEKLTASGIARLIGPHCSPRDVTALFYDRRLEDHLAPIVHGKRLIPVDLVPRIKQELARTGRIPAEVAS